VAPRVAAPEPPAAEAREIEPARDDDPVVRWRQTVDRVKETKLLLGTCLEEGLFLGLTGSNVRVALSAEHSFHRAMLEMKENREILNLTLEQLFGRGVTLVCVSADTAVSGVGHVPRAAAADLARAADLEGEVPSAPQGLVQRIVELFDGEILEPGPQGSGAS
jgi:hypothetical protein